MSEDTPYRIELPLRDNINLEILMHDNKEHMWIFTYQFNQRKDESPISKILLQNIVTAWVGYTNGEISDKIKVMMEVTNYSKAGEIEFTGVEPKQGAKGHLVYQYEKDKEGNFYLSSLKVNGEEKKYIKPREGVMLKRESTFLLEEKLKNYYGYYKLPFLREMGKEIAFEFPQNIRTN